MTNDRIKALAQLLECDEKKITEEISKNTYSQNAEEYLIVDDDEAEQLWDESLENFIDDCILPEIPEMYHFYFDNEGWKRDARINGSRGESLAGYDHNEECVEVNGNDWYIYRTN